MADRSSPHSTGTIIAVTYDNSVVLGADSRTITGTHVANRASDKITQLTDNVYLCRSGSAADSQAVSDQVRCHLHRHTMSLGRPATMKEVANIVRQISYNHKSMLRADMIMAGWDERGGGQVYGVPLGGTVNFIRKYKDEIYKVEIET